jgi:hypothetical protein
MVALHFGRIFSQAHLVTLVASRVELLAAMMNRHFFRSVPFFRALPSIPGSGRVVRVGIYISGKEIHTAEPAGSSKTHSEVTSHSILIILQVILHMNVAPGMVFDWELSNQSLGTDIYYKFKIFALSWIFRNYIY